MTMNPYIIFVLLTLLISFFIVSPIIIARNRKSGNLPARSNHHAGELIDRKETIYASIKEIEFDYEMGKLSEEDFQELRRQYKNEAVNLLKKIDQTQSKTSKSAKHKKGKAVNYCSNCGNAVAASDKFCSSCGTNLT
jgi:hypothetical protein